MSAAPPSAGNECRHARLHIGGDPGALPPEVSTHLDTCVDCRRFRDETAMIDGRLRAALELPLAKFTARPAAAPPRRFALAASLLFGLLLAGGAWMLRPQSALADEIVEHVLHEADSWDQQGRVPSAALADVLLRAGVEFDSSLPVVYAASCPFRGKRVPHLVVQTREGPMTLMLLGGERVSKRREFSEEGLRGVLLPAGEGSIALLARGTGAAPDTLAGEVVSAVHWR